MLCFRSLISEYGRVIVSTYGQEVHNQDTHWLHYHWHKRAAGTSINGSPHHHLNEGYEGLAWHHKLASISNHNPYWPNSSLENLDLPNASSPNLIFANGVVSGTICVLKAMRDCYPPPTSSLELRQRWSRASSFFGLIQRSGWTFPWLNRALLFAMHG